MNWIAFCALQHVESWTRMLAARCNLMYLVCVYVFVSVCVWNPGHHQCWEIHFTWVEGDLCRDFNYKENCDQWCQLWKQHKTSWRRLHKTCVMGRKDHMFKHDWSQFFLLLPEIVTEQIHSADLDMIFGHRDFWGDHISIILWGADGHGGGVCQAAHHYCHLWRRQRIWYFLSDTHKSMTTMSCCVCLGVLSNCGSW